MKIYYIRLSLSKNGWKESVQEIEYKETSNSYIIEREEGHWSKTKRIPKTEIGKVRMIVNTIEHQITTCFLIEKEDIVNIVLEMKDRMRSIVVYNYNTCNDLFKLV